VAAAGHCCLLLRQWQSVLIIRTRPARDPEIEAFLASIRLHCSMRSRAGGGGGGGGITFEGKMIYFNGSIPGVDSFAPSIYINVCVCVSVCVCVVGVCVCVCVCVY
jgi:hypothetical protein